MRRGRGAGQLARLGLEPWTSAPPPRQPCRHRCGSPTDAAHSQEQCGCWCVIVVVEDVHPDASGCLLPSFFSWLENHLLLFVASMAASALAASLDQELNGTPPVSISWPPCRRHQELSAATPATGVTVPPCTCKNSPGRRQPQRACLADADEIDTLPPGFYALTARASSLSACRLFRNLVRP